MPLRICLTLCTSTATDRGGVTRAVKPLGHGLGWIKGIKKPPRQNQGGRCWLSASKETNKKPPEGGLQG